MNIPVVSRCVVHVCMGVQSRSWSTFAALASFVSEWPATHKNSMRKFQGCVNHTFTLFNIAVSIQIEETPNASQVVNWKTAVIQACCDRPVFYRWADLCSTTYTQQICTLALYVTASCTLQAKNAWLTMYYFSIKMLIWGQEVIIWNT